MEVMVSRFISSYDFSPYEASSEAKVANLSHVRIIRVPCDQVSEWSRVKDRSLAYMRSE